MAAHFCLPLKWAQKFLFPEDRPSPIFSTFSVILNAAVVVWDIVIVALGCDTDTMIWVILGAINCVVNIIFAFYIYFRFVQKVRETSGASEAAYKIFMYDWGVCLYIVFFIWLIVWMVVSGTKTSNGDRCAGQLTVGIIFCVLYLIIGAFLVVISLFTECCRQPKWKMNQQIQARATAYEGPPVQATPVPQQQQQQQPQPPATNPQYAQSPQSQSQPQNKRSMLFSALFGPGQRSQQPSQQPQQGQPAYHV